MTILLNLAESVLPLVVDVLDGKYVFSFSLSGELMPISCERQLSIKHRQDLFSTGPEITVSAN